MVTGTHSIRFVGGDHQKGGTCGVTTKKTGGIEEGNGDEAREEDLRTVKEEEEERTPRMSIMTWIAVAAFEGPALRLSRRRGSVAPMRMERKTMSQRLVVMARDSETSPEKEKTRRKPTKATIVAKMRAVVSSDLTDVVSFNAKLRTTRTAAWFPALPPAPTSIVKKNTTNGCSPMMG